MDIRYPVIGYSYDSNTVGAHYDFIRTSCFAYRCDNSQQKWKEIWLNLLMILNIKVQKQKSDLWGHSLGAHVIMSTIKNLARNRKNKGIIEAVYFFGGSIPSNSLNMKNGSIAQKVIARKIRNYYSPYDDVLRLADYWNWVDKSNWV